MPFEVADKKLKDTHPESFLAQDQYIDIMNTNYHPNIHSCFLTAFYKSYITNLCNLLPVSLLLELLRDF